MFVLSIILHLQAELFNQSEELLYLIRLCLIVLIRLD